VEDHLGLVMHLAKRYAGSYQGQHLLDLEDLYQEGVLGLMHAAEKFDARKGFRFSTYATYWIRWAIGQAIMHESRTIRLPTTIWPALHHLAHAQAALWQQKQREPSPDELAERMQCAKEQVLVLLHLQHEPVSLEQPVSAEQEVTRFRDQLAAPDDSEQREQQTEVAALLKHLSPTRTAGHPDALPAWTNRCLQRRGHPIVLHGGESAARHDDRAGQGGGDTCVTEDALLGSTITLRARRLG
jgi:RNA polymerase sigma factor (sigma-70 family)